VNRRRFADAEVTTADRYNPSNVRTTVKKSPYRPWVKWGGVGLIVGAALTLFFAFFTTVTTKNIGVETSFGKPKGELSNGPHLIPFWYKVHEMDAAIQTDSYTGDDNCLPARIANQQTACVHVSLRWRIKPQGATRLYRDFRSFEHVRDSLVTRELTAAVNTQLADYNPLNSVIGGAQPRGTVPNPPLGEIAKRVTEQMRQEVGSEIEVINAIIPIITFDEQTQNRINQLQQQVALTRIAEQERLTAEAKARANNALRQSVQNTPNVLVAQCLDILTQMVKTSQPVPAGFSCWPGGSNVGVIAGGRR
jgi:hypothetical protein